MRQRKTRLRLPFGQHPESVHEEIGRVQGAAVYEVRPFFFLPPLSLSRASLPLWLAINQSSFSCYIFP